VVTHAYDADGNRVRTEVTPSTGPPTVTNFLVDPSGALSHVVAETDESGNLIAHYVRGVDDLLSVIRFTETRYYHADGLGSIRFLTDESGNAVDSYEYTAFGELLEHDGTDPQPYQFAGEPFESNAGFYHNRARWMDSSAGRFVSVDPFPGVVAEPSTLHRYSYARQDPVNLTDPTGLLLSWRDLSLVGIRAHLVISLYYAALGAAIDIRIDDENKRRPDIRFHQDARFFPGTAGEVYEIKPARAYSRGLRQINRYITGLQVADPTVLWRAGTTIAPVPPSWPGYLVHPFVANTTMFVTLEPGGIITYQFSGLPLEVTLFVISLASIAILASSAGTGLSATAGLATVNATLGGF
ncbi:MAG: RHS repeat-associated core domain-containing protein, partial [Vicinamibacteria bacterium]